MRIIDRNPQNLGWEKEYFCTGKGWNQYGRTPCHAKLAVADKDIMTRKHTDYSGDTTTYFGFVCPICRCFTEVSSKDLPYEVKELARHNQYAINREKEDI